MTYDKLPINKLKDLYQELKVRKAKGIGGEGIKDIQLRRYIETLIKSKRREEVNG